MTPRRKLKVIVPNAEEEEFDEEDIDIGETTLRKGSFSINSSGVKMEYESQESSCLDETIHISDLTQLHAIGRGASGQVWKMIHKPSGKFYALKVLTNVYDKSKRNQLLNEIRTLYSTQCPYLIECSGAYFKNQAISVILEFCDAGSLDNVMQTVGKIPEDILANMAFQMVSGLLYLRKQNQFHRDVKPQNVLLKRTGQVKLADFGLTKELDDSLEMANTFVGTCRYLSPERVQNLPYDYLSDVWSLGVLLYECASGVPLFGDRTHLALLQSILNPPIVEIKDCSDEFNDFLQQCIQKTVHHRSTLIQLLNHPWMLGHHADMATSQSKIKSWMEESLQPSSLEY